MSPALAGGFLSMVPPGKCSSSLLFHPFPLDDPVIITDNKTAEDQLGGGLVCCWGGSVGSSVAHSKLLMLRPEDSRSDGRDA